MPRIRTEQLFPVGVSSDGVEEIWPGQPWRQKFQKFLLVFSKDPRLIHYLPSTASILYNRNIQLELYRYVIHPFSQFATFWQTFMCSYIIISTVIGISACILVPRIVAYKLKNLMAYVDIPLWLDILVSFNMGFIIPQIRQIVLNRTNIIKNYLKSNFIIDFLIVFPFYLLIRNDEELIIIKLYFYILQIFRCFKLKKAYYYWSQLSFYYQINPVYNRIFLVIILIILSTFIKYPINIICKFADHYILSHGNPAYQHLLPKLTARITFKNDSISEEIIERFHAYVLHLKAYYFLFCRNGQILPTPYTFTVTTFHTLVLIFDFIVGIVLIALIISLIRVQLLPFWRHGNVLRSAETFMIHRKVTPHTRRRVQNFYISKFEDKYYNEEFINNTLSGEILGELTLHTCALLANSIDLFESLSPKAIIELATSLIPHVYFKGDIIWDYNEERIGMYFIINGEVAVFGATGNEINHYSDGCRFGESRIFSNNSRILTVIALETSFLLYLDKNAYHKHFSNYPEIYAMILQWAALNYEGILFNAKLKTDLKENETAALN